MTVRILTGDCREMLKTLPNESVHCCVTSPPYWGLRDYGVDAQIGLESSPLAFVEQLVSVFREVHRVLRSDGTLWLNLGDCYATGAGKVGDHPGGGEQGARWRGEGYRGDRTGHEGKHGYALGGGGAGPLTQPNRLPIDGLKPKDLVGIPWRVAFALQADGWYLRNDIIWSKPNPMPESVTDRCTKAHEYIFLLAKSERYYFDSESIAEPVAGDPSAPRNRWDMRDYDVPGQKPQKRISRSGNSERKPASARGVPVDTNGRSAGAVAGSIPWEGSTRNKRSVWTVPTKPLAEAHFATFPTALIEPCILAGCPEGGLVLDPFFGAGTVGLVADAHRRECIGIELNPKYVEIARNRLHSAAPLFSEVSA